MKFNCPYCSKELNLMDLKLEEDLNAIIKMQPLFGRQANLVWAYVSLFGVTPMKAKTAKIRALLEEVKTLFEQERFSYQKKIYPISAAGIVRALDITVKKNFSEHLENHNYLKKVMIGISEEESRQASKAAEKGLRAREERLRDGNRDERTEESDQANLARVQGLIKTIG